MNTQTATLVDGNRCSLCWTNLRHSGRAVATMEERLAEHVSRLHMAPEVGDFVSYTMVTDTRTFEVTKVTAKTVTIREMKDGEIVKREDRDGTGWPQVWTAQHSDELGVTHTVRLRKDGTYRMFGAAGGVLRPATMIEGLPTRYTDYRM